jgi:hypothetical protein
MGQGDATRKAVLEIFQEQDLQHPFLQFQPLGVAKPWTLLELPVVPKVTPRQQPYSVGEYTTS